MPPDQTAATARSSPRAQTNPVLPDVPGAINALSGTGLRSELAGLFENFALSTSHLQGIAEYHGRWLISENRWDHVEGRLNLFNVVGGTCAGFVMLGTDLPPSRGGAYNHPGGIERIGDYLLVPIQTQDYRRSVVQLWDLSPLRGDAGQIVLVNGDYLPLSNDHGLGAIGMAATGSGFVAAATTDASVRFYTAPGSGITDAKYSFAFEAKMDAPATQASLLVEEGGGLYLIAFVARRRLLTFVDWVHLYRVDLNEGRLIPVLERHFTCRSGCVTLFGTHFRWAAGVIFGAEGGLGLAATQRVIQPRCTLNTFAQLAPKRGGLM